MLAGVVVIGGGAAAYVNIERSKREKEEQCRRDQAVSKINIPTSSSFWYQLTASH